MRYVLRILGPVICVVQVVQVVQVAQVPEGMVTNGNKKNTTVTT